jgi:hypothetical protein
MRQINRKLLITSCVVCLAVISVVYMGISENHKKATDVVLTNSNKSAASSNTQEPTISTDNTSSNTNIATPILPSIPAPTVADKLSYSDKLPYTTAANALSDAATMVQTSLTSTEPLAAEDDMQNASFEMSEIPVFNSSGYSVTVQMNVTKIKTDMSSAYSYLEQALTASENYNTYNSEATTSLENENTSSYITLSGEAGNYRTDFYTDTEQAQGSLLDVQSTLNQL